MPANIVRIFVCLFFLQSLTISSAITFLSFESLGEK
jgi:hypothetical protein